MGKWGLFFTHVCQEKKLVATTCLHLYKKHHFPILIQLQDRSRLISETT